MNEPTHAEQAAQLAADVGPEASWSVTDRLALAQVHATLALVDAIESWRPPLEDEEPEPVEMSREEFQARWGG